MTQPTKAKPLTNDELKLLVAASRPSVSTDPRHERVLCEVMAISVEALQDLGIRMDRYRASGITFNLIPEAQEYLFDGKVIGEKLEMPVKTRAEIKGRPAAPASRDF